MSVTETIKRGPNAYELQITISFTNTIAIPTGGKVELTTTNDWTYVSTITTCTGSGFIDLNASTNFACAYDTSLYRVNNIGDISAATGMSITINRLKVPDVSPGTINFLTSLISYDASGNVIENWLTSASNT